MTAAVPAFATPPSIPGDSLASPLLKEGPLLFPTVEFAIFFPIVLALSWAFMPKAADLESRS